MNKEIQLILTLKAGSDFQYEHGRSLLTGIAESVKNHLLSTHKENEVSYSLSIDNIVEILTEEDKEIINNLEQE